MNIHHERIQERAYALWVEEGRVHGLANDYWFRAERELNYVGRPMTRPAIEAPVAAKKAPRRRRASGKTAA